MRAVAEAGQPANAPPVASLGSFRMIAVEHKAHMNKLHNRASLGSSYVGTCNNVFGNPHLASKPFVFIVLFKFLEIYFHIKTNFLLLGFSQAISNPIMF